MNIKKRSVKLLSLAVSLVFIFAVVLSLNLATVSAATSGSCGDNATWSYNESTNTLTISGSGATKNYSMTSKVPWESYKSNITTLVVNEGITEIGNYSFYNCTALANVSLPSTLTALKGMGTGVGDKEASYGCFKNCTALESITLPENLTTIGDYAFSGCTALKQIVLPDKVTSIGNYAFLNCESLSTVSFGSSVTETGSYAFYNSGLKKIAKWGGVKKISAWSFFNCGFTEIELPEQVTTLSTRCLANCTFLMKCVVNNVDTSFSGDPLNGSSQEITIWGHKGSTAEEYASSKDYKFKSLDACEHESTHEEITVEATCTETGILSVVCDNEDCDLTDNIVSQSTISALGHNYVETERVDNTEIDGHIYTTETCSRCGDTQDKIEHQRAAEGSDTTYVWVDGYYEHTNTATCEKAGIERYTCTVEGCYMIGKIVTSETLSVSLGSHNVENYEVTTAATCTEAGEEKGTCTVCGNEVTQTIAATGHSYTEDNLIETVDNTEVDGHIYKVYECQNCHEQIEDNVEHVAWVDGSYTARVVTEPRCVIDGAEIDTCSVCQKVRTVTLPANGQHEWYVTSTTEPTCTAVGKIYYACENCTLTKSENIDALGHDYQKNEDTSVAPTCVKSGYDNYVCQRCGATSKQTLAALGHTVDEDNYTVITPETCEEDGSAVSVCTVCGETFDITLKALGHDYQDVIVDLTSENKPGHSLVTPTCTRCNSTTTASISHDEWLQGYYTTESVTSATCIIQGTTRDTCTICNTKKINTTPALGHNYNYDGTLSCDGMEYKCSICRMTTKIDANEVMSYWSQNYINSKNIQRTGTDNSSYLDANGDGIINAKDYAIIRYAVRNMPEHNFVESVVEPTCAQEGYTVHTCSVCSTTYNSDYTEIVADAHSFDDSVEFCQNGCGTANPNYVASLVETTTEDTSTKSE
jgi:hypothetical protein